jgi:hypothetical protein
MSDHEADDHDLNAVAAYAEGRLEAMEKARVAAHLSTCESCRATLAGLLRELDGVTEVRTPRRVAIWLPLAATLTLAVGGGFLAYRTRGPLSTPTSLPAAPAEPNLPPQSDDPSRGAPAVAPPPATSPRSPSPAPAPEPDRRRGAEDRRIGEKTFRLVAGEWVDTAYDRYALLETVTITTPAQREELLERFPELRSYEALGPRFTVVNGRVVYRFAVPAAGR